MGHRAPSIARLLLEEGLTVSHVFTEVHRDREHQEKARFRMSNENYSGGEGARRVADAYHTENPHMHRESSSTQTDTQMLTVQMYSQ